ncbi:predicted protein [Nematostella vectensis]|uniref:MAM domain-containing protein n=2 Tax=Nematostella vectensis TaxID=45351 RepID=A7RFP1_NEMVE|nr:predicted protein [Nematostella vectensis]|eukprot:XP_001641817.1 predicted protein [Nematostella vectensis]
MAIMLPIVLLGADKLSNSQYGIAFVEHVYRSLTDLDLLECAIRCRREECCRSLNFNHESMLCELNYLTKAILPNREKLRKASLYLDLLKSPKVEDFCTFDSSIDDCGYSHDRTGDFAWGILRGKTSTKSTGPDADHTSTKGLYIYIEASTPRVIGDRAILRSKMYPASPRPRCVRFFWHMYGFAMGSVQITYKPRNSTEETVIWERSGNHRNAWFPGKAEVPPLPTDYQVSFIAIRGNNAAGDSAIDDVFITDGNCC